MSKMTTTYSAGFNRPGYLPEMDPIECRTFDEAKRATIDAVKQHEDEYGADEDEDTAEGLAHFAEDINLESSPFDSVAPDGYAYWVQEVKRLAVPTRYKVSVYTGPIAVGSVAAEATREGFVVTCEGTEAIHVMVPATEEYEGRTDRIGAAMDVFYGRVFGHVLSFNHNAWKVISEYYDENAEGFGTPGFTVPS